ncbi:MAG: TolC family protein [Candidatus Acidiferrales bacterium]
MRKGMSRILLAAIFGAVLHPPSAAAQKAGSQQQQPPPSEREEQGMEGMEMDKMPTVRPELPRFGRAQENPSGRLIQLKDLEQMALEKNPTLVQANAEIRAAKARQQQSGLYPNPKAGYAGEEIRGGSFGGGEQGFFVSQSFVTGGKLGLNRKIVGQEVRISEMEAQEQQLRVLNGVRLAYYRVLTAQEMLDTRKDLARIAAETVKTARELRNIGQADESEVLQAEVDEQKAEMDVMTQQNTFRQEWRALAAVTGNPNLEAGIAAGYLDKDLPELDEQRAIEVLLHDSPAVAIAQARVARAEAVLGRARREPIPDIEVRAGMQHSGEFLEPTNRPVGLIGFAEVGVQIPIFNHNQGNVHAARDDIERAQAETRRVELVLRERSAGVLDLYRNSEIMVNQYRDQLLPRAQKAYELLVQKYGLVTASYPQVLKAEHTLYQLHADYISALEGLWVHGITLKGLLLTDGLEPPARPGEVDLPVREINVPMTQPATLGRSQP